MLARLFVFLAGQIILVGGCWLTITSLLRRKKLMTIWGSVISAWYVYLLIWYGPSSLFAALGADYVKEIATHPWWLREDTLLIALSTAIILQIVPLVFNILVFKVSLPVKSLLFTRLEPLLGHVSCLWFGLLGTFAQVYTAVVFRGMWLEGQFNFGALSIVQKLFLSGFFIFTVGPQIALIFYRKYRNNTFLSAYAMNWILCLSILMGTFSFAAFGQRTYALIEIVLLAVFVYTVAGRYKNLIVLCIPFVLFVGYMITSMQARIKFTEGPVDMVSVVAGRLVDDFAYRSHLANDSVIIGARSCVLTQLHDLGLNQAFILPVEIASGFPQPLRQSLPLDLTSARLESLVGNCYRQWLGAPNTNIDLTDSKMQYFLTIFGVELSAFIGSVFWLLLHLICIGLICSVFYAGFHGIAFALPASTHLLVLGTTPGEVFVLVKALTPYVVLLTLMGVVFNRMKILKSI